MLDEAFGVGEVGSVKDGLAMGEHPPSPPLYAFWGTAARRHCATGVSDDPLV